MAQFQALQPLWSDLLEKSGQSSPFLSHGWFWCCLTAYGRGKDLFVLVLREGSGVVGIAPFWRYSETVRAIPMRSLGYISGPDTPFADFVLREGRREEALDTLLRNLYGSSKGAWDMLTLNPWDTRSPNYEVLHNLLGRRGGRFFEVTTSMTPFITIQGGWEAFLQTRSARFRKTRRNIINRIGNLPNVDLQCASRDEATLLKDIFSVSEKCWKEKRGIAISSREDTRRLFEELTRLGERRGWLLVWLLKVDGVPIAMEYDLCHGGDVYALRADFDGEYKAYSPGAYLEYHIIKYLFENGYREYNMGPGMNSYKLHWTEQMKKNVALSLCNDTLKGWVVWTLERRLIPFLKGVVERVTRPPTGERGLNQPEDARAASYD